MITGEEGIFSSVSSPLSVVTPETLVQKWLIKTPPGGQLVVDWEIKAYKESEVKVSDLIFYLLNNKIYSHGFLVCYLSNTQIIQALCLIFLQNKNQVL